jgi:hypothetical protein
MSETMVVCGITFYRRHPDIYTAADGRVQLRQKGPGRGWSAHIGPIASKFASTPPDDALKCAMRTAQAVASVVATLEKEAVK